MAANPIDLITLEEAKLRLRVLHDDEDESIQDMVTQASAAVLDYVKLTDDEVAALPARRSILLKFATQNMVKWMYNDKDALLSYSKLALGYLPDSVTMFLHRIKTPTMA